MIEANYIRKIGEKTLILPELIPLLIPDFLKHSERVIADVLSFKQEDSEKWFNGFVNVVESKLGKDYYPVMRMSDGEYRFLIGDVYPVFHGNDLSTYLKKIISVTGRRLLGTSKFKAATLPGVSSGEYTKEEIRKQQEYIVACIKKISKSGVLALHLTYSLRPFQEHYHYPLKKWMEKNQITLNADNYYPFYFVYALLRGSSKERILRNKKVIVFHGSTGKKQRRIVQSLINEGVSDVMWHTISSNRTMFDTIKIQKEYFKADLALVGAGVGKFNILSQLEPLNIPCIDAGYVFEVWADEENKWRRPIMIPDWEWDEDKVNFMD